MPEQTSARTVEVLFLGRSDFADAAREAKDLARRDGVAVTVRRAGPLQRWIVEKPDAASTRIGPEDTTARSSGGDDGTEQTLTGALLAALRDSNVVMKVTSESDADDAGPRDDDGDGYTYSEDIGWWGVLSDDYEFASFADASHFAKTVAIRFAVEVQLVEVNRCWEVIVPDAIKSQLVEAYLKEEERDMPGPVIWPDDEPPSLKPRRPLRSLRADPRFQRWLFNELEEELPPEDND